MWPALVRVEVGTWWSPGGHLLQCFVVWLLGLAVC